MTITARPTLITGGSRGIGRGIALKLVYTAGLALLAALGTSVPTRAAFPGQNGVIVFASDRDGDSEIYYMAADGSGLTQLTFNTVSDTSPHVSSRALRSTWSCPRCRTSTSPATRTCTSPSACSKRSKSPTTS